MTSRVALVTGLAGQDGGYLAEHLATRGWSVHGLVRVGERLPVELSALGDALAVHEGDLADHDGLTELVAAVQPSAIFNLAGISSVAQSWNEPVLTAQTNALPVVVLLQAALELQERSGRPVALVQASSAEIFSGTETIPQDELTPLAPRSPYGAAKAFAHHLVQAYRGRGLHASNAILYNHESPRRPTSFVTRKITATVAAIAAGQAGELVLGDLSVRRDWGWAPDYVAAMAAMAAQPRPGDYVIATGTSHTVEDFVRTAFERVGVTQWREFVRTDPRLLRVFDAADLVGDSSRARTDLGWRPTADFADVVGRMVDHDVALAAAR